MGSAFRIFHTADLHLGKKLHGYSLHQDQRFILDQIIERAREYRPQLFIIAGDVFDHPIPDQDALRLFEYFLDQLVQLDIQVLVINGNHDSAERLSFGAQFMKASGVHIFGTYADEPQYLEFCCDATAKLAKSMLSEGHNPVVNGRGQATDCATQTPLRLVCWPLPFCRPRQHGDFSDFQEALSYELERIKASSAFLDADANIAVAHHFVLSQGMPPNESDSERKTLGTLAEVSAESFEGFDYVALGHIHKPQFMGSACIYYAGSPLAYSFSECYPKKSLACLDLYPATDKPEDLKLPKDVRILMGDRALLVHERLELKPLRKIEELRGSYEEIASGRIVPACTDSYLRIILTDKIPIPEAFERLSKRFAHLMLLEYERRTSIFEDRQGIDLSRRSLGPASYKELFERFYRQQIGDELSNYQDKQLASLFEECTYQQDDWPQNDRAAAREVRP